MTALIAGQLALRIAIAQERAGAAYTGSVLVPSGERATAETITMLKEESGVLQQPIAVRMEQTDDLPGDDPVGTPHIDSDVFLTAATV